MFHSSDKFEMSSSRSEIYAMNKNKSFTLQISTAFILTLLSLVIAIGVGLIVHFAGGNKTVVCQCSCGDGSNSDGQVGCPEKTTQDVTCTPSTSEMTTTGSHPTSSLPTSPPITNDVLLPSALSPTHYNVILRPNLYGGIPANFNLEGSVRIYVTCNENTANITLHIQNLNITTGTINVVETPSEKVLSVSNSYADDSARHFLIIEMAESLQSRSEYYIEMDFTGPLQNTDLSGLYYSTYTEGDETKYMAITQFQPTDARKAFPSFDEPGLKATFNITLERRPENNVITLSNMPQINTVNSTDGYVADVYDTTVVMPTYLLAFAVCDFQYKENTTKYGHTFRTYARAQYIQHTNYSLWVGSTLLDAFEEYFEIGYPLPKLDMIAIPDFSAGAMENWGLVTYRESIMFYHPDISTASQHIYTAIVVSHELAHMVCKTIEFDGLKEILNNTYFNAANQLLLLNWFGNLISPKWWDDLWLNEGFATFFEYLGVDMVETDWDMMNYIALDCVQYSFETDSLISSRPIYQEVWTPSEINSIFDVITYFKGASVIRMMWFFLGEDIFRRGLRDYIRERQYGNVHHDDLWQALSKESQINGTNVNVTRVMDTWIEQKNYPLLNVTITTNGMIVTQQRFLLGESSNSTQSYVWEIPLTYTTNIESNFQKDFRDVIWMNATETTINVPNITTAKWIILNIQEFGYYRVNYPEEIWTALTTQLTENHIAIHVVNRAALISDAWALNKAGFLHINTALHTLDYLDKEQEYIPWGAAIKELSYLDRMLVSKPAYGNFERFMVDKVNFTFMENKLNIIQDQSVQKILLQSSVASRACKYGIELCSEEAKVIFNDWKKDPDNYIIAPDIKQTVLCTSIRHGTSDDWDFVFSRYANSSANDQNIFANAMSCTKDIWVLNRYLEYSIDESKIRSQNARSVILSIASNPIGQNIAWIFVRSNWQYLVQDSAIDSYALNQIVIGLTRSFYTEYDLKQVEIWKAEHPTSADYLPGFDQAIETVKINMAWDKNNYQFIEKWLLDNYSL